MYITNTAGCASGGTYETYATSKSWTLGQTNATATVYVKFKDAAGNESTCINDTITHNNTAPTSTSISINSAAVYTNSTAATLTLAATGATDMYITNTTGCASGGTYETYATTKSWTLGQTNATATVYVKFKNSSGNESACINDTIIHDNTVPTTTTISINSAAVYTNSTAATLTLAATGASDMYITNTTGCASGGTYETYATTKSWTLGQTNATATVYVKFKNSSGNESACINDTITHDNAAPTSTSISINSAAVYTNSTAATLTLAATGASDMYITNTAGCATGGTYETYGTTKSWTLGQSNTTATVYIKFKDAAGNETTCINDTITHDNIAPTGTNISINSEAATTTSTDATLTLAATGATDMYITNTAGCASGGTYETYATTKSWTLGQTIDTATVYVKFKDAAGNETTCINDTISVGSAYVAPASASTSVGTFDGYNTNFPVTLTWDSTASTSGFQFYQVEYKTLSASTWTAAETCNYYCYPTQFSDSSRTFTVNLQPSTEYSFRVKSVYGSDYSGISVWTQTTLTVPAVPADAYPAPATASTSVGTFEAYNGTYPVTLEWDSTGSTSGFQYYQVEYKATSASNWMAAETCNWGCYPAQFYDSSRTFTVNLQPSTEYSFRVKSIYGDIPGYPSPWTTVSLTTPGLAGPPVLSVASKNFNAAFSVLVSQNSTPMPNFTNFRYATALNASVAEPTCSTGTLLNAGGSIPIFARTTSIAVISCDSYGAASPVATATYTFDRSPPGAPTISPSSKSFNAAFNVSVTEAFSPSADFKEFRYATASATTVNAPKTCSSGTPLADGATISIPSSTTSIGVIACDNAGNPSFEAKATYVFDNTAPGVPALSAGSRTFGTPFNVTVTRTTLPDITFTEFRYTSASGSSVAAPADCSSGTSLASGGTIAISASTTAISVIACDATGNKSNAVAAVYTYNSSTDDVPPVAGIFMASSSLSTNSYTLNWEAATDNATAQGSLQYYVCKAKAFEDIDTIAECEVSSMQARDYATGTSFATTASGPMNYFNVIVRDTIGNKSLYNGKAQRQYTPNLPVGFNSTVSAIALGSDGTQYVGGYFTSAGLTTGGFAPISSTTGNLATANSELNSVVGSVSASAPDGNGGVYLGGSFTSVGGVARNRLAHIDRYGNVDLQWNPNANSDVYAIAVSGSTVYLGGLFTTMGGAARNYLAAVDATTGALSSWNPNANDQVNTLIVSGSTVYVGGRFGTIGGVTRGKLAAIGSDGTLLPWDPTANNYVFALAISGSTVYVGGQFTAMGPLNTVRNRLASVDATSGALSSWDPNANSVVYAFAVSGSTLYVGGNFNQLGGVTTRTRLAAFSIADGTLLAWDPNASSASSYVNAIAVSGSTVYVGGNFTTMSSGNTARNYLAAVDATTGALTSWNPSASALVNTITVSGSTVYAGGTFTLMNGVARNYLAAVNPDGSLNTTWNPHAGSIVSALAVSGSTVYVGGLFTTMTASLTSRNYLAAIGTDGVLNTTWNPNANQRVYAIAVSGSTVYVGGNFTTIGGTTRNRLAAIGTDGTLSTTWNPNANSAVYVVAVYGSTVYVGGDFTTMGVVTERIRLAAIGTDGTLSSWNPNANGSVYAIAFSGSTVYVGGWFTTMGGVARNRLAAIGTDGTLSTTWNPNANSAVYAIAASGDTLYAAGVFTSIGGTTRNRLAAVGTNGTLSTWNPNAGNAVNFVAVSGSTVYAGGDFTTVGAANTAPYYASIGADGILNSPSGASPYVAGITLSSPSGTGTSTSGTNLDVSVSFNTTVTVTGSPTLAITVGSVARTATYLSGSGSSTLVFRYTTTSGDLGTVGIPASPISLNSGTIQNATLVNADLAFSATTTIRTIFGTTPSAPVITLGTQVAGSPLTVTISEGWVGGSFIDVRYVTDGVSALSCTNSGAQFMSSTSSPVTFVIPDSTTIIRAIVCRTLSNQVTASAETLYTRTISSAATPPTAGIFMASTSLSATGYTLNWEAATDNTTAQGSLQYYVCKAKAFEDVDTIAECEVSSRQVRDYATGTSFATTASGPMNYFNVIVRDGDGNKSLYNGKAQRQYAPSLPVGFSGGAVNAIALGSDGTQYVGGSFSSAGITTGGFAPISSTTGNLTTANSELNSLVGYGVLASAPDGNGGVYLGGNFVVVGGIDRNRLAHIDRYGNVDLLWNPNANSDVYAIAVSGSTVYVGGTFTTMGASLTTRNRLAAVDATTGRLSSWDPNANSTVSAIVVSGSTVYAGGNFTNMGGTARNYLAAIGTDGTLSSWNPNANNAVSAIAVSGSTVYVGGTFTTMGGTARNRLAAIGTDGTLSTTWDPNSNNTVTAIAVSGSTVYAGGNFTTMGGTARNNLAAIGTDGTLSTTWNPTANSGVSAIAVSGSTVYVGGSFTGIGCASGCTQIPSTARNSLAAIGTDGTLNTTWNPSASGWVNAIAVSGTTVYAGGTFKSMNQVARNYLAAVNPDGSLNTTWNPSASSTINAIAVSGSTVYVGGAFTTIGCASGCSQIPSTARNRLAAIGTNGTLSSWDPNANNTVNAIAVSGSTVYVGGSFTTMTASLTVRNRLAAIGTDGVLNTTWNPNANNTVSAIAVSGSTVYVGGTFTTMGGSTTRNRLAAVDATNGTLSSWDPNASSVVSAIAVSGSTVYVGGSFTTMTASLTSRNYLAAIGTDGTLSSWNPNANNAVIAIAVSGTTVYVGGQFTAMTASGSARNRLAAIGTDDTLSTTWNPNASTHVRAIAVSGSTVYVGGDFLTMGAANTALYYAPIGADGILNSPSGANPYVAGITLSSPSGTGTSTSGTNLDVSVFFNTTVTVTGSPTLAMTVGSVARTATYLSGSGSSTLVFRYTTTSSDLGTVAIPASQISLNSGTIQNATLVNADLAFSATTTTRTIFGTTPSAPVITLGTQVAGSPLTVTVSEGWVGGSFIDVRYVTDGVSALSCTTAGAQFMSSTSSTVTFVISDSTTIIRAIVCRTLNNQATASAETLYTRTISSAATPPTAGIFMASTSLSATGYTLNWEAATDNFTAQGSLQYYVCKAKAFEDIDTIAECEVSSRQARDYATGTSFATSASGPMNYFNVIVRDGDGNKSLYNGKAQRQYAPSLPVGFNNTVNAIALGSDGTQYVGGAFTSAGTTTGNFAPISSATGNLATANSELNSVNGTVSASAPDGNGGVYLGGTFTFVGGIARNNLAHIDRYGNVDLQWNPNANNAVNALAVSGSTVYVGGSFSAMGGTVRNRLAAVDATTGRLSSWNPNANNTVSAIVVSGSTVYVGGMFTTMGGMARNYLAAIGTDGTLSSWNPNANNTINALAVSGTTVYVGGNFTTMGGTARNRLAAIGTDGVLNTTWNPNANSTVSAIAVSGSSVYVGGAFTTMNGTTRMFLAAIDATNGTLSPTWNPNSNGNIIALALSGSTVYVGGSFTTMGGTARNYFAAIGTDGVLNTTWNPSANNAVSAIAVSGTTVYAGGSFTLMNEVARNYLAAVNPDGTLSTTWNPNASTTVTVIAVSGSTVYVGGSFLTIGGITRNRLAALGTDGALSTTWNPNANNTVNALAVSGTTVYVGGSFTTMSALGTVRNRLAAVDATTGTLSSWDPNANNTVNALAVSGTTVYVGGSFTAMSASLTTRNRLAAIGTDGTLNLTWNPNADNTVNAIAVSGSTVYVGGSFTYMGGALRYRLAAIGTDGVLSTTWNPSVGNQVNTIAVSGSTVYVGGAFSAMGPTFTTTRISLGAVDATTGILSSWNPSPNSSVVNALAVSGSTVYVGGTFMTIGGNAAPKYAPISADGILNSPSGASPYVAAITISSPSGAGTSASGTNLDVSVSFSTAVTVTGSPTLAITVGDASRTATYLSGSGSNTIVFRYTADWSDLGMVSFPSSPVTLNGGTIQSSSLVNADLWFSATTTSRNINGLTPPVVTPGTQTISGAITATISRNLGDIYFSEFRYTTDFVSMLDCTNDSLMVSASSAIPTAVDIPAMTTTLRAIACDNQMVASSETAVTYTYSGSASGGGSTGSSGGSTGSSSGGSSGGGSSDVIPPVGGIFMSTTNIGTTGYTLNWETAADDTSATSNLRYLVCTAADYDSIKTISACESANVIMYYEAAATSIAITQQNPEQLAYYNVIVMDEADNKTLYNGKSEITPASSPMSNYVFNSLVSASGIGDDGTLYLGGAFTTLQQLSGSFAPISSSTGNLTKTVASLPRVVGSVVALQRDGKGGIILGGTFTVVAGIPRNNLARVDRYGNLDLAWNPNANNTVNAIAVSGSTVYMGGTFTTMGGVTRNRLAAVDVSTGALSSWNPNAEWTVHSLAISGSTVYVGGAFFNVGGIARNRLAAIGTNGILSSWNPNANNQVYALAISGSTVYVGGAFTAIGCASGCTQIPSTTRNRLAAIDATNGTLLSWDPNANNTVNAIAVSGSTVYVGGTFTTMTASATTRNRLAAIGTDGTLSSWNPNANGTVSALAVSGSTVYVGGDFTTMTASLTARNRLAAIGTDGTLSSWNPNANGTVSALAVSGSTVYVGGWFSGIGAPITRNRLAAINPDGTLSTTYNPNADGNISALAVSGSTVYVGGAFTSIGCASGCSQIPSTTRNRVAAIGTDGTLNLTWNPNANNTVTALAASGSTVYVGGTFTTMGGVTRPYLAAVETDGTLSPTWNPTANNQVYSIAVSGSTIYVGGAFSTMTAMTRNYLAAIGTNGTLSSWNPNANASVNALAVSGTMVYVGGNFTTMNGTTRNRLAAIGTDGTLNSNWNPSASTTVNAIAVSGSTIYVGGAFTTLGDALITRNRLAAIGTDGTLLSWNPNANATVSGIAVSGSTVYVRGYFTAMGSIVRSLIATIGTDGSLLP